MAIHDVTVTISAATPIYKGDPGVEIKSFKAIANGSSANVSQVAFGVHSATHVDAPNHFIDGGRVHELDPNRLVGKCRVVEVPTDVTAIEPQHVGDIDGIQRCCSRQRTLNSGRRPRTDSGPILRISCPRPRSCLPTLASCSSASITSPSRKAVRRDIPSISRLLEKEIVILEGVDLRRDCTRRLRAHLHAAQVRRRYG